MVVHADTLSVFDGDALWAVECGSARERMASWPSDSVHCAITSPPYYALRDYGVSGQIGLEDTPERYVEQLVEVFREVRRVLHPSGCLWLNLGDSYNQGAKGIAGIKAKDLLGIPWMVAFALRSSGWYLRQWCPWVKRNPMPESVTDRPGTACETVFLLSKESSYFFDMEAVKREPVTEADGRGSWEERLANGHPRERYGKRPPKKGVTGYTMPSIAPSETGRNFRSSDLWFDSVGMGGERDDFTLLGFDVTTKPYKGAHFAVMPKKLIEPCVLSGTSARGVCPKCGEPWVRQVRRERKATRPGTDTKVTGDKMTDGHRDPERHVTTTETVGWEAGCACGEPNTIPAIVMDPFAGSGTVIQVAVDHGRRAIGIELNPEYVALIHKRMAAVTPPLFA